MPRYASTAGEGNGFVCRISSRRAMAPILVPTIIVATNIRGGGGGAAARAGLVKRLLVAGAQRVDDVREEHEQVEDAHDQARGAHPGVDVLLPRIQALHDRDGTQDRLADEEPDDAVDQRVASDLQVPALRLAVAGRAERGREDLLAVL